MSTEPLDAEALFQRHNDIAFRLVEKLLRHLLARDVHPYAVSNALISHGVTLLASVDGRTDAAEFMESSAGALRELDEAANIPADRKH